MKSKKKYDVIIVGASLAGLTHAYQVALIGFSVLVIDKNSIDETFTYLNPQGILRPFGESLGHDYHLALRSREIWLDLFEKLQLPYHTQGSYTIAQSKEEFDLMEEFYERIKKTSYRASLLLPYQIIEKSGIFRDAGIWGGLYSPTEVSFDAPDLYTRWLSYLSNELKVDFLWETNVDSIKKEEVKTQNMAYCANIVFVCCNSTFSFLNPLVESSSNTIGRLYLTQLQTKSSKYKLGTIITGALTLLHDKPTQELNAIKVLKNTLSITENKLYAQNLHFIVSQSPKGQILIATYQNDISIPHTINEDEMESIIRESINKLIKLPRVTLISKKQYQYNWSGVRIEPITNPESGIYIINTLAQSHFNLSMGQAYDNINRLMVMQNQI